ncbi:alpha/beta-type small acid-soluble spore protein [Paenibacillus sp. KS-LC4]|uniref:alpha/beta-type small acid-soluble spore protein n=1 Tax=Paenibacillus sp. KS-LC4 TaxID=2979727 RepID=UPI0030D0293C
MSRSNKVAVPLSKAALQQMKYEIAEEFGLYSYVSDPFGDDTEFAGELGAVPQTRGSVHWSQLSTRQAGSVGGEMTKRLVAQAESVLNGYI